MSGVFRRDNSQLLTTRFDLAEGSHQVVFGIIFTLHIDVSFANWSNVVANERHICHVVVRINVHEEYLKETKQKDGCLLQETEYRVEDEVEESIKEVFGNMFCFWKLSPGWRFWRWWKDIILHCIKIFYIESFSKKFFFFFFFFFWWSWTTSWWLWCFFFLFSSFS